MLENESFESSKCFLAIKVMNYDSFRTLLKVTSIYSTNAIHASFSKNIVPILCKRNLKFENRLLVIHETQHGKY